MGTEIETLIDNSKYEEALRLINLEVSAIRDFENKDVEEKYLKLIQQRILVKMRLGQVDEIIHDNFRKNKYPSEKRYLVSDKHKITLQHGSAFSFQSDAYVHTIHSEKYFEGASDRSATKDFVRAVGLGKIRAHFQNSNLSKGDFIVLNHPNLCAPMSYHILFYEDQGKDFESLRNGIIRVLDNARSRGLRKINFLPLAFNLVIKAETKEDKNAVATEIANTVAETIINYIYENKNRSIPDIYFNTTNYETMGTFDKAFERWAGYDRQYLLWRKQLSETERELVRLSLTRDEAYIKSLKELCACINEKTSILILGETGVGKSHLARDLHKLRDLHKDKYVVINCAELGHETLNVQLFGCKKGSYTDSKEEIKGAIELAEGGTLFLDEIGCTDNVMQGKLLKFIGDGTYRILGDNEERKANVKLIFGTNEDLEKLSQAGEFRHDLFERIAQITIEIPPLRNRSGDISLYVEHFLYVLNKDSEVKVQIADDAKSELMKFLWPGNVRQLESYMAKLHISKKQNNESIITKDDILSAPPRNYFYGQNRSFQELENSLLHFLASWLPEDGKFIDDFIQPIVAKLYIDDIEGIKKQSGKITGMDGTGGNDGMLNKQYRKYLIVKDKFNK